MENKPVRRKESITETTLSPKNGLTRYAVHVIRVPIILKLAKFILLMPATNAASEQTFSVLRRLKTWLRSTMHQTRFNWCMILHVHKDDTDMLDYQAVANDFVCHNSSCHTVFGTFAV